MEIALPKNKLHALRILAKRMLRTWTTKVQNLARLLGTLVAEYSAILLAPINYRCLEMAKSKALRRSLGYVSEVDVTAEMTEELQWWAEESPHHNGRPLQIT